MILIEIKIYETKIKTKLKIKKEIKEKLFIRFIKSFKRRIENNNTINIALLLMIIKRFIIKKTKIMLENDEFDFLKLNLFQFAIIDFLFKTRSKKIKSVKIIINIEKFIYIFKNLSKLKVISEIIFLSIILQLSNNINIRFFYKPSKVDK